MPVAPSSSAPSSAAFPRPGTPLPLRLFIELWPGPAVRRQLAACRDLQAWPPRARPIPDRQLHLTLHFIGAVPAARLDEVAAALAVPAPAFDLTLDRVATWSHGLVVLEAGTVPEALRGLHADLAGVLRRLALPVEARPLRPHVTLARHAGAGGAWVQPAPVHWRVRGHALVQSLPQAPYRVLRHYR